jgi:HlyD family secretion protein
LRPDVVWFGEMLPPEALQSAMRAASRCELFLSVGTSGLVEPAAFTKVSALGVEEQRVNVVLDFAEPLDKVQTIGDAFRVDARIIVFEENNAIRVPVAALFREGEGFAAFVVEGDTARKRAVKAPRRNATEALVEEGLQPGEQVVVYPSDALREGARVEVVRNGQR